MTPAPSSRPPSAVSEHADLDSGLLSPVRAGSRVEAAVSDFSWLQAMLDAEAALVRAQQRVGLVPQDAADAIAGCARAELFDLTGIARRARDAANPVVCLVQDLTGAVAAVDPAAAEYVHRGSTSQDILDTAAMLVARGAFVLITADLDRAAAAAARLAADHRGTLMPGRTLTQHAVPTTFGLKAAGWLQALTDATDRIRRLLDGALPVQLGGAAGTLAGYLEYARLDGPRPAGQAGDAAFAADLISAYARELGLAEPVLPWHTVRTPIADIAAALAFTAGALGKIAADVLSLARTEVAEVAEPAAEGRGVSSAMPQKRNPVLATLIRSAALQVPAQAMILNYCMYAEDERPAGAWHAEWQPLREGLRLTGGAAACAAELLEGIRVDAARMRENLDSTGGLIVAERLAAALTPLLGKRAAKAALTRASAQAARTGRPFAAVLAQMPELEGRISEARLTDLLDPADYCGAAAYLTDRALKQETHHVGTAPDPSSDQV
ncbi:3-carboxy-cis,cis-muconate cycloisomerase [Actinocrinis puniceicyclus]|uniref:3-carboxy-cis,cis-muconate cycloisomerase n=1 Tax=Actinocrinis puniceicyclus TaxID=977794 RepID=A0A8J8BEB4_9ACTN|nr:3-carboxy-cis,cis-muconate cycloisomerase [Actinocrinis puniceicyclus]MBS2966203.1 3-carboxy-cis,cis-muconate cycloisomerase [Actinocrinis puniceicyclus]